MLVADYIFEHLAARGVKDVFTVTGGGIMYLVDALGRNPDIKYWCNFHEQACAISAEGYSRVTGGLGVCLVTTGPGSTNALSAIAGAWVDSVPVLVISGQVRTKLIADYSKHRQIGPQEVNIIPMVEPVVKYATTLTADDDIALELERAIRIATSGRPGPVWLNIPLDVQSVEMDTTRGHEFLFASDGEDEPASGDTAGIRKVVQMLRESSRPLIVTGNAIHLAGAESEFKRFVEHLGCPVICQMGGMDLLPEDHPLYMGRFGPTGQRRANFTLQNADLLLCVGAGMSVSAVGWDTENFAPDAKRVMINIDPQELAKPYFPVDLGVVADVKWFMSRLMADHPDLELAVDPDWLQAISEWKRDYPLLTDDYWEDKEHANSYVLAHRISELMQPGEVILTGNASDAVSVHHSFVVKPDQRIITNYGFGAMGWDLPAVVGACVAQGGKRTVLVTGDGSIALNIQELLTLGRHRLNVKVFIINNGGYESIRATQNTFFDGRFVGCHEESGVYNPDFKPLAAAYGLEYRYFRTNEDIDRGLAEIMDTDGPFLVEVNVSFEQEKCPKITSRRQEDGSFVSCSLDDQYPFLPAEEREAIMKRFRDRDASQ